MPSGTKRIAGPPTFDMLEIDPAYRDRHAIVAALQAAGHRAIAQVAKGAVWECDSDIAIDPSTGEHAERLALIWQRAADHLEGSEAAAIRAGSGRGAGAPARNAPAPRRIGHEPLRSALRPE